MMLLFYDFEFNLIFAETKITSLRWSLKHSGIGSFEAHIPLSSDVLDLLCENNYLVVVYKGLSAIVAGYQLGDDLTIYGRTCNFLLSKRVTKAFSAVSGLSGELSRGFAEVAFADVDNFCIGSVEKGTETQIESSDIITNSLIERCIAHDNLGYEIVFDTKNKKWVFNILPSNENEIIFSEANKNAYNLQLSYDILDLAHGGYYLPKDMEESLYIENSQASGIYRWETLLAPSTEQEALSELKSEKICDEVSLCARCAKFGTDYQLGDVVRVQVIKGSLKKTFKKRISGVEIRASQNDSYEMPIFEDFITNGGDNIE